MVTGLPIAAGPMLGRVASGRSLTPEENERVLAVVRELLKEEGASQTSIAPKLGLKQPTLSAWLAGKHQGGYPTARNLAALMGVSVERLLGGDASDGEDHDQRPRRRPELGNHREFERHFAEFLRRVGDEYPDDIRDAVAGATFGTGVPEFIDWRVIEALAQAEMQVRKLKRERAAADKAADDDAAARARAMGAEPGSKADVGKKIAAAGKKKSRARSE
jgi:transcriptional regulator with XRE-family HTH domain